MSEKEKLIQEMERLTVAELRMLQSMLYSIRRKKSVVRKTDNKNKAYLEIRQALKSVRGSLADDIASMRDER